MVVVVVVMVAVAVAVVVVVVLVVVVVGGSDYIWQIPCTQRRVHRPPPKKKQMLPNCCSVAECLLFVDLFPKTPWADTIILSLQRLGGLASADFACRMQSAAASWNRSKAKMTRQTWAYPLKLQALNKLIFYRHIAHVTPNKLKSCVFKRKSAKHFDPAIVTTNKATTSN